jgi:riboflavin synthase
VFTGIVEKTQRIIAVADGPGFRRLTLPNTWPDVRPGESIAINGCCLTVAEIWAKELGFDVIEQTLSKTNLGSLQAGMEVNIERSLRLGDRLDGHFVQGHIDGRAQLLEIIGSSETRLKLRSPHDLLKFIIPQGSITLDGVSLTIASQNQDVFEVALIPTTMNLTTLGTVSPGWWLNLETDVLCKTVISWLQRTAFPRPMIP